jgi:hypothetical protein
VAKCRFADLVRHDPLEAIAVGDVVDDPHEPRERVGQRAVEIEDDELAVHGSSRAPPARLRASSTR